MATQLLKHTRNWCHCNPWQLAWQAGNPGPHVSLKVADRSAPGLSAEIIPTVKAKTKIITKALRVMSITSLDFCRFPLRLRVSRGRDVLACCCTGQHSEPSHVPVRMSIRHCLSRLLLDLR